MDRSNQMNVYTFRIFHRFLVKKRGSASVGGKLTQINEGKFDYACGTGVRRTKAAACFGQSASIAFANPLEDSSAWA